MPRRFLLAWFAFAILFSVHITGCTVINYWVGSSIDKGQKPRVRAGDRPGVIKLEPGSKVVFHMTDSSTVAGTYLGLLIEPTAEYAQRYEAWREQRGIEAPPKIGERVRVNNRATASITEGNPRGEFLGFGPDRMHLRVTVSKSRLEFVPLNHIHTIYEDSGRKLTREDLEKLREQLPVQAIARVKEGDVERHVDLGGEGIARVEIGPLTHGFRTTGIVLGILTDATLVVIAGAFATSGPAYSGSGCSYNPGPYWIVTSPVSSSLRDSVWFLPHAPMASVTQP